MTRGGPRRSALRVLLTVLLLAAGCASGHRPPYDPTPPARRDLAGLTRRLQGAAAASPQVTLTTIGGAPEAAFQLPLWEVRFRGNGTARARILVAAGVHGNEPAGVESALGLVERLARDPGALAACDVDILPLVNPWGWVHDVRFNRHGRDINRDFSRPRSPEAQRVAAALEGRRYDLMVDLHEDPAATGFYLYQYGRAERRAARQVVDAIQTLGYPVETRVKMVTLKTRHGVIDAPLWGLRYMQLSGQLSIANYFRLYHSANVFTLETPTVLPLPDRLRIQRRALEMLVALLVGAA